MSGSYDAQEWINSQQTWPEWVKARARRRKLIRWAWYFVAVAGACLLIVAGLRVMFVIP